VSDLTFHIDTGTATPEEIAELFDKMSQLSRELGGPELTFEVKEER